MKLLDLSYFDKLEKKVSNTDIVLIDTSMIIHPVINWNREQREHQSLRDFLYFVE